MVLRSNERKRGTFLSQMRRDETVAGNAVPRWGVRTLINRFGWGSSWPILNVGIDLAQNVFTFHAVNEAGRA
ncbi:hypothetical protein [Caldimonas sp. KR1-144]|uniref:hypothetical protein n=1 Tax=Caldimonas sp. KR1-144 TaxID=3400911 RepID=UPI003C113A44